MIWQSATNVVVRRPAVWLRSNRHSALLPQQSVSQSVSKSLSQSTARPLNAAELVKLCNLKYEICSIETWCKSYFFLSVTFYT